MKRKVVMALLLACSMTLGAVPGIGGIAFAAEKSQEETGNKYFALNGESVNIQDTGVYTFQLQTKDGWQFDIAENTDVTAWLVNAEGNPAIIDKEGVAFAANGEDEFHITVTVDASKITGFTSNGSADLYVMPTGKPVLAAGDNKGQYKASLEKIGAYTIPAVEIDGVLEGEIAGKDGMTFTQDAVTVALKLDGLDDSLIDGTQASISLLPGDGYYVEEFAFSTGRLADNWTNGESSYSIKVGDIAYTNGGYELTENGGGRGWSEQGGDGNGNYNFNLGVSGIYYNGLPLAEASFKMHLYCYGRTFDVDGGSLIANAQPAWSTTAENDLPILCDVYPDELDVTWPIDFDASALTTEDFTLTMRSEYGDELVLEAGTDFVVESGVTKSVITVSYMLWANTPVYTTLTVDVNPENLSWNEEKYNVTRVSHDYDIASVYCYYVMSGGMTGTQTWSYYGVDGMEEWEQVCNIPNYTLTLVDDNGVVNYYTEDENGNGAFTDIADKATVFDAREDCAAQIVENTVFFTRVYDQTEEKEIDGTVYTFDKVYGNADNVPLEPGDCTGITAKPGYVLGGSFGEHLKWPWQSFIGVGYLGGTK